MHVGVCSSLATGKVFLTLLGVATITMVFPGGDMALSQRGTGTSAQAPLITAINLHPRGFTKSYALGVSRGLQVGVGVAPGDFNHALLWRGSAASVVHLDPTGMAAEVHGACGEQQVGYGTGPTMAGTAHALLWRGTAASVVDLNPNGFDGSVALGTSGGQQVGAGNGHALLWRGTAASVVDLHPRGFTSSRALATSGAEQVGYGDLSRNGRNYHHALLWRGTAASLVDLHPRGFSSSEALGVAGGQQVGHGSGPVTGAFSDSGVLAGIFHDHALLWHASAASVVDLNSPGLDESQANATNGEEQVGIGDGPATRGEAHALLWRGGAASVTDLHTFLPPGFVHSSALAIDGAGNVVGSASTLTGPSGDDYAILWKRTLPRYGTSQKQNTSGC
ncbi:MAG TPA: hypothetical protein VHM88_26385 [Candidatus Acidoferrales bacterium]|nr:hypothetical protein [Candidatus Acidoferrales bacterium]